MIEGFLASWDLFYITYLVGWLIGLTLSVLGVLVVARDQVFLGAAVSQASMLGVATGMLLSGWVGGTAGQWLGSDQVLSGIAVGFAVAAAVLTGRARVVRAESHEALAGWVFLISASLSPLLLVHSPHGLEDIQRLLSSSLIGASGSDFIALLLLTLITFCVLAVCHRRALLLALDPTMAATVGMELWWWNTGLYAWLGVAIGLSMRVSGVLYVFGSLVLPALIAKNVCRSIRGIWFVAPSTSLATGIFGFILANHYDFPPAQVVVALQCLLLAGTWWVHRLRAA